jgi:hypothetical protein
MENNMSNRFRFGGPGGKEQTVNPAGFTMEFRYGTVIDFIKIGTQEFGGKGGHDTASVDVPTDGIMKLRKIQSGDGNKKDVIGYLELEINGTLLRVGKEERDNKQRTTIDFQEQPANVRLVSINSGTYIDSMTFEII